MKIFNFEVDRLNLYLKDIDIVITIPKIKYEKSYGVQMPTTILIRTETYFQKWSFYIGILGFGIGFSYKPEEDHKCFRKGYGE